MSDIATNTSTTTAVGPLGHKVMVERTVQCLVGGSRSTSSVIRRGRPRCHLVWPPLTEFELDIEAENPLRWFLFGLP